MNNRNVLASIIASVVVMTALVSAGFIPAANDALAQVTNSSATNSTSSSTISTNNTASIHLNPTSAQAGSTVSVTGTGFTSGSTVKLTLDSASITTSPASITVTSSGTFAATFTVPSNVSAAGAHSITATDSTQSATSVLTTTSSTTSTATTASTASSPASVGSTTVQQGTVSSNNGNLTILIPRSDGAVFTGTISYAAGSSVELYVLHAYGTTSGQTVNSTLAAPKTMVGQDGKTYAVSVITNAGSSAGDSGSTVFSGNGLMLHSTGGGTFIATYTLKATIDTPTVVNSVSPTTASSTTTSAVTSANTTAATNTTSSTSINSTSGSSSSSATITAAAGSSNETITVSGQGFSPKSQVTTVVTLNGGNSGPTTSATTDSSGAFTLQMPLTTTVHGATIQIKTTSSGGTVAKTTYTVP